MQPHISSNSKTFQLTKISVNRLPFKAEPMKLFFGLSGHGADVLGLLETAPSAGFVHVAGLCIGDWFRATALETQIIFVAEQEIAYLFAHRVKRNRENF